MRLIIAGGRDFADRTLMEEKLKEFYNFGDCFDIGKPNITEIVHGCANGADKMGESIAIDWNIDYTPFPADWEKYGDSAGPIRNEEMKQYGHLLIAFWDGNSTGTKDMIDRASKVMPVNVVKYERRMNLNRVIDIIFDWETLNTKPHSAVASIGIIPFYRNENVGFDELVSNGKRFKFDLPSQYRDGRTYSEDTINFWKDPENSVAFERTIRVTGEEILLSDFPDQLQIYLDGIGYSIDENVGGYIWNRGNAFDFPIMENIFDYYGAMVPFPYWMLRDIRTTIDSYCELIDPNHDGWGYIPDFKDPEGFIKHIELHDCARDILQMQEAKRRLVGRIRESIK